MRFDKANPQIAKEINSWREHGLIKFEDSDSLDAIFARILETIRVEISYWDDR
jgi:hypothetical protein